MRKVNYREGLRNNYGTKEAKESTPRKATAKKTPPAKPTVKKTAKQATPEKLEKTAPKKAPNHQKLLK